MNVNIIPFKDCPEDIKQIASPPDRLFWTGMGVKEVLVKHRVAVVGSRKVTQYGRQVTEQITSKLARAGVVIISGLAFGVDACAHRAALGAGGCTLAVLPTPLNKISPTSHTGLAKEILAGGGALISEYGDQDKITKENFIARNRLVSALSEVLLITEATKISGSLHTARFALEQGKTVMAVPGNITSQTSDGCNNLIKSGAIPVTSADDILFALKISTPEARPKRVFKGSPAEQQLYILVSAGKTSQEDLASASQLSSTEIMSALTSLELAGYIKPAGGGHWTLA